MENADGKDDFWATGRHHRQNYCCVLEMWSRGSRLNPFPSTELELGFSPGLWWLSGKESTCNAGPIGAVGSVLGLRRSPGEGNGNPHQYSCMENPMDRIARCATIHGVAINQTWLKQFSLYFILKFMWYSPVLAHCEATGQATKPGPRWCSNCCPAPKSTDPFHSSEV